MNSILKFSAIIGATLVLASCSNYGYISENDVYMQAPTEINLDENEDDITSFNAFKARQKGAFDQEYKDPRVNETVRFNSIMMMNAYRPFGSSRYHYMNGPIAFHGMGYHPYGYEYRGFNSGLGLVLTYGGGSSFYYNQMDPFGYGFGYGYGYSPFHYGNYYGGYYGNSYYGNSYYGNGYYGNGYYGNGYHNGGIANNNSNSSPNQPSYYGKRSSISSSSNRSSYNPSKSMANQNQNSSYDVNNQTLGDSRRDVQRRSAGASDYSDGFSKNGVPLNSGVKNNSNSQLNNAPTHRTMVNNSYTPNSSARRTGAVQQQRQSNVTVNSSRSVGSTRSSGTLNSQSTRTSSPSTTSPRMQTTQPSQRMSTSPSGSSSRGSSSSSSSSTSRRR